MRDALRLFAVDFQDHVARAQTGRPGGTVRVRKPGDADDEHALRVHRRADVFAARIKDALLLHAHFDLLDRHAQQRNGQLRALLPFSDNAQHFVRRGEHLHACVVRRNLIRPADGYLAEFAGARVDRFRKRRDGLRLRRVVAGQNERREQDANPFSDFFHATHFPLPPAFFCK